MPHPVLPADVGVTIGEVVLGKYRVDAVLGTGASGVVVKCTHLQLNEQVAIKMLRKDVILDQEALRRFIREAQAANKLKSEHVARVHDVGTFDSGVPYMVMEFLDGKDLGQLLLDQGPIHWQLAVELGLQAAEALAEAHSIAIVHRDIKPSNLFIGWRPDGTPQIKVLDFGISKSQTAADMSLTQTQSLLGTPAYMSPEQMRSAREVDQRSDIWSLGTVLFELIEGRRPFIADSFSEMVVKVAMDPPTAMVNAPPPLQAVIMRCLDKQPERRYGNMAELGRDLIRLSRDPHAALVMVERMQRVLRRSTPDWDGQSQSSGTPLPRGAQDFASSPIALGAPSFEDRTPPPPPMAPMQIAPSGPVVPPALAVVLPDPAAAPHARRTKLLWAGGLLGAAGVGIGAALAMRPKPPPLSRPLPSTTSTSTSMATPPAMPPPATPDAGTAAPAVVADAALGASDRGDPGDAAPAAATTVPRIKHRPHVWCDRWNRPRGCQKR